MTLAIGFGRDAGRRPRGRHRLARRRLRRRPKAAYDSGWSAYLDLAEGAAGAASRATRRCSGSTSSRCSCSPRSEDKTYRGASIAAPNMPWIWGTLTLGRRQADLRPVPPRLAARLLPRGHRAEGGGRRRGGGPARSTTCGGSRSRTATCLAEHARRRHAEKWTSRAARRGRRCPIVLAWWLGRTGAADWAHVRAAADYLVNNEDRPRSGQERWENQDGYSPNTIATEIAGAVCAADVARSNGDAGARRPRTRRSPTSGSRRWRAGPRPTNGPYSPQAVLPARDQGRRARQRPRRTRSATTSPARSTSARSSTTRSSGLVLFGVKRWNDPTILNSLKVGDAARAPIR